MITGFFVYPDASIFAQQISDFGGKNGGISVPLGVFLGVLILSFCSYNLAKDRHGFNGPGARLAIRAYHVFLRNYIKANGALGHVTPLDAGILYDPGRLDAVQHPHASPRGYAAWLPTFISHCAHNSR